ncbi:MAG TPA: chemotaxis protein CheB [Polyangiaceae bacterium]|jgi:two-component system CheB/CheR fusion protein|nr:chemotaxis protein CheB [Polyangiaceae bacterium]
MSSVDRPLTEENVQGVPASIKPALPHVVGIGASAGGLEALERFFDNVTKDSGMAFVVIQHLSPDFKSLMDEILGRRTPLPIRLVEDSMVVEPNHIYLIPPKKEMIISGGRLLLSERDRDQELTLPIDVFFRSLAQDCGARAVAVVLSGGGSDGSRGIRAVHDAGGLVMIQDMESAQFDGMPRTARDAGVADYVLPPQDMPAVLLEHATRAGLPRMKDGDGELGMSAVYGMLEQEFGIDFTHYKPSTITRRIERRLQLSHIGDIEEYVKKLKGEHKELDVLYRDLLIGVTRFFRNDEAFDALEKEILPELLKTGAPDVPFRVWVAGCATGEEVYSLAILLSELTAESGRQFKIFATDVHRGSLEHATRGVYDETAVANVSASRLERFFLPRGRSYQIVPDLRQAVVFAHHNVVRDAPFRRVDLVSCRNMLIYLRPPAQEKVLSLFHFALNRGGVMFLGPSESLGHLDHDFETINKNWRIYRKFSDSRMPVERRMPPPAKGAMSGAGRLGIATSGIIGPARYSVTQLLGTYDTLLDELMPPSLLVDDRGELVHTFGGASRFLKLRDGRQGLDVFEMVDSELRMVLMGGVPRAMKEPTAIVFKGVCLDDVNYKVTIRRVSSKKGVAAHVLISLDTMAEELRLPAMPETEIDLRDVSRAQMGALEAELSRTKENLQAATEGLETSNEELQAANEELLASNEELQSTNEELQSVNEELYSVNAEYQRKIADLTELANDMDNLLSSTDIGTIFLDRELKIRKFTPQIADSFNLLPQDVGRPIETFTHAVDHPELNDDLKRVLADGERVERELRDRNGRAFFLRILPYRAKGAVDGVVLTLIDVSGLKAAEDALFHERYLLNSLLFSIPDAIYFKDARGRFIRANQPMAARLGLDDPREAVGKTGFELPSHAAALTAHQQDEAVLQGGAAEHYKLEKRERPGRAAEWDLVSRLPLTDGSRIVGVIGIFRNVTEQKLAEEKIQDAVKRRDEFLAMLSHELRNPLGAIVSATSLLKTSADGPQPYAKLLGILERQAQQMARLLDDLLEVGRVTQDKVELRKSVFDLRPIVNDAVDAARNFMEARGIALSVEIDSKPLYVDGDATRLQQIQVNLLNNAAKYTPRGGHVVLRATVEDGMATIRVRDDGVGIAKDMLDSVFDLFVQSTRTLDRAEGGLGVGLTLVRGLVTKHGGEVTAQSDGEGKGSEFVVRLPLVAPPAESAPVHRPDGLKLPPGSKIVIIEDNTDSREVLCALLSHAGFDCRSADSGDVGLALIDEFQPRAAIVDIGLPGIDGLELARRVRKGLKHPNVYLIALTGYGRRGDREMALQAGFNEHLVKPVDLDTLSRFFGNGKDAERVN